MLYHIEKWKRLRNADLDYNVDKRSSHEEYTGWSGGYILLGLVNDGRKI
jgi:hypothetical protein